MADLEEKKFKNQNTTSHILGGGILTIYFPFGNKRKVDLPLCLCLCLLICLSVCLPACLPACFSVSFTVSQRLLVSWSLPLDLSWSFLVFHYISMSLVSQCLSLSATLSPPLSATLSVCLPACLALSLSLSLFCRTGGPFSQHKLNKYSMMLCIKEVCKYPYISSNPSMQPGHECPVLTGIVNPCYSSLLPLFIFGMLVE